MNDRDRTRDRKVLVLPATLNVDDLPVGSGGAWEWIHEVAVLGKAGRIDVEAGCSTADAVSRRAGQLHLLARALELTAALLRLSPEASHSPTTLAGGVKRLVERGLAAGQGLDLVCGTCGVAWIGAGDEVECPSCAGPIDPAAAKLRAAATDPGGLPETPAADDWSMF